MSHHWGEIPTPPGPGISAEEIEEITRLRPIELKEPKVFMISDPDLFPDLNFRRDFPRPEDPEGEKDPRKSPSSPRAVPGTSGTSGTSGADVTRKIVVDHLGENVQRGKGTPFRVPPEINLALAHEILRSSVAALCVHAGFVTTTDSVLDFLTDVSQEYLFRITQMLRANVDQEGLTGNTGFVDVLEQTFHDCGVGGIAVLQKYYNDTASGFRDRLRESLKLLRECEGQQVPENQSPEEGEPVQQPQDDEATEVKPPLAEGEEKAVQVPPQLEKAQVTSESAESDSSASSKDEELLKEPPSQADEEEVPVLTLGEDFDTDIEIVVLSD